MYEQKPRGCVSCHNISVYSSPILVINGENERSQKGNR